MRTVRYKCDICSVLMEPSEKELPIYMHRDADICDTCLEGILKYQEISTRTGKQPKMEEQ